MSEFKSDPFSGPNEPTHVQEGGPGESSRDPAPRKSWWKRKLWKLPVWAWITIAVLIAAAGTGGGDSESKRSPADTEVMGAATMTQPTATSSGAREATPTAAAAEQNETPAEADDVETPAVAGEAVIAEEAASPTPVVLSADDVREVVFPIVFESVRDDMIAILDGESSGLQSVDKFDYDTDTGTVVVSVTSRMRSDENIRNDAWLLTQGFVPFWADRWVNRDPFWAPDLDITVSGLKYRCSAEQMISMADTRFSREDWESGCRVS